jgi:hypothetical protein
MGGGTCPAKQLQYYNGGGLFTLDLKTYRWSARDENNVAQLYGFSALNPNEPGWIYMAGGIGQSDLFKFNWRTGQRIALGGPDGKGCCSDFSMEYCPLDTCLYVFVMTSIWRYSIRLNRWTDMKPAGTVPNAHQQNVDYDTLNQVFTCFYDSMFYYYSPMENTWRRIQTRLPVDVAYHHLIYDPVNNVHVMLDYVWKTFAYKFSDTPGRFPGTAVEAARRAALPAGGIGLFPNPVSKGRSLRVDARGVEKLSVYGLDGRKITDLQAGASWKADVAPGLYLIRGGTFTKRLVVLK